MRTRHTLAALLGAGALLGGMLVGTPAEAAPGSTSFGATSVKSVNAKKDFIVLTGGTKIKYDDNDYIKRCIYDAGTNSEIVCIDAPPGVLTPASREGRIANFERMALSVGATLEGQYYPQPKGSSFLFLKVYVINGGIVY